MANDQLSCNKHLAGTKLVCSQLETAKPAGLSEKSVNAALDIATLCGVVALVV
jgi:hypothetical protein